MDITIAILPFKTLTRENNNLMLLEGFVEDLTTNLSKFMGLSVISYETIRNLDDENAPVSELQTDYLVKGSFREYDNSCRIDIQLIRKKDYAIIFTKDYDFSFDHMFQTQDEILQQIVNIIQQQIDYDLLSFSYKAEPTDLKVYESYLLGMKAMKKGGASYDEEARTHFEDALKKDPNYSRAYTGIALSYVNEWSCQVITQWDVIRNGAQKYALKALALDENDYVALSVAGRSFLFTREFDKAEHYLQKSLRMNPNDAANLIQVAFCFMFLGYVSEAVKLYEKARKLNPLHPDYYFAYGQNFYFEAGDFRRAIELGNKVHIESSFVDFAAFMAAAHYHVSEYDKMNDYWQIYLKKHGEVILNTGEINEEEALNWQIKANPYKDHTNLKPFWEHMAGQRNIVPVSNSVHIPENIFSNQFKKAGDLWEITFAHQSVIVQDLKGLNDIWTLIQRPDEEIHCSELIGSAVVEEKRIELIDQKAKQDYQKKILQLQEDIAEAEVLNNYEEIERLQNDYDAILEHLSSSMGLAGKVRKSTSQIDKARSAVTWRIRNSIKKLDEVHPALAKHFSASVRTGIFCSYKPERPVEWVL